MKVWFVILLIFAFQAKALAVNRAADYRGPMEWSEFQDYVLHQQKEEERLGTAYMISGALAVIGGTVGYTESDDMFSRTIFALTSNIGIAGLGLGATYYFTDSSLDSFFYAVNGANLSLSEKNELLQRYLRKEREERERRNWIRVTTHALLAAANLYSGSREESGEARSFLYFLGGANAVLAVTYSF